MKNISFFISIIYFFMQQYQSYVVYQNADFEILAISTDSLMYRLKNDGGFETYSFLLGSYKKKSEKLIIDQSYYPFAFSKISIGSEQINNTRVVLLDNDLKPIIYSGVNIIVDNLKFSFYTDSLGSFEVTQLPIINKQVTIEIGQLSNTFNYKVLISNGRTNTIISKISTQFGVNNSINSIRSCLNIKYKSDKEIEVYDSKMKKWKVFNKKNSNHSFAEVIDYLCITK